MLNNTIFHVRGSFLVRLLVILLWAVGGGVAYFVVVINAAFLLSETLLAIALWPSILIDIPNVEDGLVSLIGWCVTGAIVGVVVDAMKRIGEWDRRRNSRRW